MTPLYDLVIVEGIMGTGKSGLAWSAPPTAVVDEIVIDASRRGRGYGTMLVRHAIALAAKRKLDCVRLSCSMAKPEFTPVLREAWVQCADEDLCSVSR